MWRDQLSRAICFAVPLLRIIVPCLIQCPVTLFNRFASCFILERRLCRTPVQLCVTRRYNDAGEKVCAIVIVSRVCDGYVFVTSKV